MAPRTLVESFDIRGSMIGGTLTRDGIALVRLIGKYLRIGDNRSLTWSV